MKIFGTGNMKIPAVQSQKVSFGSKAAPDKDCFCHENKKYNDAIAHAKEEIMKHIRQESPAEYSAAISKDGEVLSESEGTYCHCDLDSSKLKAPCTIIHGHPEKSLLSRGDLQLLLNTAMAEDIIAITPDGTYSKLSKMDGCSFKNSDSREIENDYMKNMLDIFEISYEDTEEDIEEERKRYAEKTFIPENIVAGIELKDIKEYLRVFDPQFALNPQKKFNQHRSEMFDAINSDINLRLKVEDRFLKQQSQKYGLKYSASF